MNYEVLSPWADVDKGVLKSILPRVTDLAGKTIGLFSFFKPHGRLINKELEKRLQERFPTARFSHYFFPLHGLEIIKCDEYKATFAEWVKSVDIAITSHSD